MRKSFRNRNCCNFSVIGFAFELKQKSIAEPKPLINFAEALESCLFSSGAPEPCYFETRAPQPETSLKMPHEASSYASDIMIKIS